MGEEKSLQSKRDKIIEILKNVSRPPSYDIAGIYRWRNRVADEILASQWISVEDEPPEEKQPVWAWTPKFKRQYTVVAPLKEHFTHWQPLPAPPETDE